VAGAAALAFGISGFYTFPLRDYARFSIRGGGEGGGVGMEYATQWSLAPFELPSLVVPGWAGFGGQTYWGGMPFTDYPNAYLGMIAVLLALPAFASRPREGGMAPRVFALALGLFALLISFGRNFPLYGFLYDHLPLFNKFRVPVMAVILLQAAAALGTAWGASAALEPPAGKAGRDAIDRVLLAAGAVLVLCALAATVGRDALRGGYVSFATGHHPGFPPDAAEVAFRGFASDLMRASILGLLALCALWFCRRGRLPAGAAWLAVLFLLLVELWPVSGSVMKPVIGDVAQRNVDLGRDDVVEFLEHQGNAAQFRILPLEEYQSNRFAGFGIASVGGYHAAKPRIFQDLFEAKMHQDPMWLRLLNVRYLVTRQPLSGTLPPYLRSVHEGAGGAVYENLAALPRATVVGAWHVTSPTRAILDSVSAGTRNAADFAWLDRDPGIPPADVAGATATITSYRLNDLEVDVSTPAPALLRIADLWHPDWTATVDGAHAPVLRADYLLRAVVVPAGRHHVVLRFASKAVRTGLMLSLASIAAVLGLLAVEFLRRPSPARAALAGAA
jgi:hypothetical protein